MQPQHGTQYLQALKGAESVINLTVRYLQLVECSPKKKRGSGGDGYFYKKDKDGFFLLENLFFVKDLMDEKKDNLYCQNILWGINFF